MTKDLEGKHILIVGKDPDERVRFVDELISGTNRIIYRFAPNLKTFADYIDQVKELFPFIPANWSEQNTKKWTRNQVWDFHLDWTENTHSILVVLEEFAEMEEKWRLAIIGHYLQKSYYQEGQNDGRLNFQLIVTQRKDDGLVEKLIPIFGLSDNEKRTEKQVILGKLKIIDLDHA